MADVQPGCAGPRRERDPREHHPGAPRCWAFRLDVAQGRRGGGHGRGDAPSARTWSSTTPASAPGGLIWEHAEGLGWVIGVNLMGVAHGVRVFTPMMLEAARSDPSLRGHIVNTASMAGMVKYAQHGRLQRRPACGGVAQRDAAPGSVPGHRPDRCLRCCARISCPPASTPATATGRPTCSGTAAKPTRSQLIAQAMTDKAVGSGGKVTAAQVAQFVMDAVREALYVYSPRSRSASCSASRTSCWRATERPFAAAGRSAPSFAGAARTAVKATQGAAGRGIGGGPAADGPPRRWLRKPA